MLHELLSLIPQAWQAPFASEPLRSALTAIANALYVERQSHTVYPSLPSIFRAMDYFPPHGTRVVILGQDPYIGPNQAMGLAFSVPRGEPSPPSLRNILQEVIRDVGATTITDGDLTPWAQQGVLLLNTTLTVRAGESLSHAHWGWERITDAFVRLVVQHAPHAVYMLWGRHAQQKRCLLSVADALVLQAPHPSPLSARRGFFGSSHFSQANAYLAAHGLGTIRW